MKDKEVSPLTEKEKYLGKVMIKGYKRQRCELFSRVMGYHRPVSQYNIGKKSEFYSREFFTEKVAGNSKFMKQYA